MSIREKGRAAAQGLQSPTGSGARLAFEPHCTVPDLVRAVPHIAFEVDDLEAALCGREVLIAPNSPSGGVRVAFIVVNGAPVELMEFADANDPRRAKRETTRR